GAAGEHPPPAVPRGDAADRPRRLGRVAADRVATAGDLLLRAAGRCANGKANPPATDLGGTDRGQPRHLDPPLAVRDNRSRSPSPRRLTIRRRHARYHLRLPVSVRLGLPPRTDVSGEVPVRARR